MKVDPGLREALARAGSFDASACLNCGTCTALCPVGLPLLPRRILRHALLGDREGIVAASETIYSCLLCGMCEENCPAGVHITDNVRALRVYLAREAFGLAVAEG